MNVMNGFGNIFGKSMLSSNGKMPSGNASPPSRQPSNGRMPNRQNPSPNRSLLSRPKLSQDLFLKACLTLQNGRQKNWKNASVSEIKSTPSKKIPNKQGVSLSRQNKSRDRQSPRSNRSLLSRQKLSPNLLRKACMTEQNELPLNGKNEHLNSRPSLRPSPFQKACMTLQSERQKN